jgi:hypothetical protein
MHDRNENLRFTLRNILVVTTLLAVAISVAHWTGSPELSAVCLLLVFGWALHKFLHANLAGLIPCLVGVGCFVLPGINWVYRAVDPFLAEIYLSFLGTFFLAVVSAYSAIWGTAVAVSRAGKLPMRASSWSSSSPAGQ